MVGFSWFVFFFVVFFRINLLFNNNFYLCFLGSRRYNKDKGVRDNVFEK